MRKRKGLKIKRWTWILAVVALALGLIYSSRYYLVKWMNEGFGLSLQVNARPIGISEQEWCRRNYEEEFQIVANEEGVSLPYLLALAVLECGGERPAGSRFEPHIYKKLIRVKEGKREDFEGIKSVDLENFNDDELRQLATSWGPFQLMGYQCIKLDVDLTDIIDGTEAYRIACKWMKKNYGTYLESNRFRDAFHMHNAGSPFPESGVAQTHSRDYVPRGLRYMKYFSNH